MPRKGGEKKGTARNRQMKVDVGQRRARTAGPKSRAHKVWHRQVIVDMGQRRARTAEPEPRAHMPDMD